MSIILYFIKGTNIVTFDTPKDNTISKVFKRDNNIVLLYENKNEDNIDEIINYLTTDDKVKTINTYKTTVGKKYNTDELEYFLKTQNIDIKYVNSQNETLPSLLDKSEFTVYEKEIISYLDNQGPQKIVWAGGNRKLKSELQKIAVENHKDFLNKKIIDSCKNLKQQLNTYKCGLIVNNSNGRMNGKAFSLKSGQIFNSYKEFENFFIERNIAAGYNVILFNSNKAAENCKIALQNPLLRFTIYRSQDDQNMGRRVYRYIPNIDWSDDRVKTDEGLLQVCGCPADKAKEYAEYCKKIIEEVNKK